MSAVNLVWAYSQKLNNPTAKAVLVFLCSHNFENDQFIFKISTISTLTEFSERSVREALKFLSDKNLIIKKARFNEKGQQISNEYVLNITQEYKQKFYENNYKLSTGGVQELQWWRAPAAAPGVRQMPTYNNKYNNNNINKNYASRNEKNKNETKCTVPEWGKGHPSYDSLHGKN